MEEKIMKKSFLARLLALTIVTVMLLSTLVGCFNLGKEEEESKSDDTVDTSDATTNDDTDGDPTDEEPTEEEPTDEEPTDEEPTDEEPTDEEPTDEEPTDEEPTDEEPTDEEPTDEEPTDEEPTDEEPTDEEPTDEEPTDEEPTHEEPTDEKPTETETEETDTWGQNKVTSVVGDEKLDFGGASVGVACRPEERYRREISLDGTGSDPLSMQIHFRNQQVQKQLNCKLEFIEAPALWGTGADANIANYVKAEYDAGTNSNVDVIFANAAYTVHNDVRVYLQNLNSDEMSYMDIEQPYWNQSYVSQATCYDQLYYIVGDLTLTIYDKAMVTFVNFNKLKSIGVQPEDIYALVDSTGEDQWTFKKFEEIALSYSYTDANNDYEVNEGDDVRVSTVWVSEGLDGYFAAFELTAVQTNDDGSHTITVDSDPKFEAAATMVYNFYQNEGMYKINDTVKPFYNFQGGNSLFHTDLIYRNATQNKDLRNVEFDYGILPLPKYSNDQLQYHTTSQDAYNAISVLNCREDEFVMISAFLDLMCSKSYDNVRPFYIEKMMKTEYADDADSTRMIKIIMDGLIFDTATIYSFQMNRIAMDMWRSCAGSGTSRDEKWAAMQQTTVEAIKAFDMFFQASQFI